MPNDLTVYQHVYVDHDRTKAFFIVTDADGTERFRATRTYEAHPLDRIARENVRALKKRLNASYGMTHLRSVVTSSVCFVGLGRLTGN
jgi:hypothetical protein